MANWPTPTFVALVRYGELLSRYGSDAPRPAAWGRAGTPHLHRLRGANEHGPSTTRAVRAAVNANVSAAAEGRGRETRRPHIEVSRRACSSHHVHKERSRCGEANAILATAMTRRDLIHDARRRGNGYLPIVRSL